MNNNIIHILILISIASWALSCSVVNKQKSNQSSSQIDYEKQLNNTAIFIDSKRAVFRGELDEAIALLKQILQNDPINHAAYYELSRIILAKDNLKIALNYAEQANQLDPNNYWYKTHLYELYIKAKEPKKAVNLCEEMIQSQPFNINNYYLIINAFLHDGNAEKAIDTYRKMEKKFPFEDKFVIRRKEIYVQIKKYDKAAQEMQTLIDAFPMNKRYYGLIADVYMADLKYEKAMQSYKKILELDPNDGKVHLVLASWYSANNQTEASFEELKKAFESTGLPIDDKIEVMVKLYDIIGKNKDDKKLQLRADTLLSILSEKHPKNPKVLAIKADFLAKDKKWEEALEAYKEGMELDSTKYLIWEQIVLIYNELEDYKAMQNYARRAMELFPQYPIMYYFNAKAQSHLVRFAEAEASLNLGLSFVYKPTQQAAFYTLLGAVRDSMLRFNEAEVSFEKAFIADPNSSEVLIAFSQHLASQKKDKEKALSMAAKAVELNVDQLDCLYNYAETLMLFGEMEKSELWIKKGLTIDPENKKLHWLYGNLLNAIGKKEEALKHWNIGKK